MKCAVVIKQSYHAIAFEFSDEMSAIQFATISKEHACKIVDRDGDDVITNVTVIIDPNSDDIDD